MSARPACLAQIAASLVLAALIGSRGVAAADAPDAAAQANNPLANMTALNFQDYYIGRITDTEFVLAGLLDGLTRLAVNLWPSVSLLGLACADCALP
jgi:hypothetical protein